MIICAHFTYYLRISQCVSALQMPALRHFYTGSISRSWSCSFVVTLITREIAWCKHFLECACQWRFSPDKRCTKEAQRFRNDWGNLMLPRFLARVQLMPKSLIPGVTCLNKWLKGTFFLNICLEAMNGLKRDLPFENALSILGNQLLSRGP